MPSSNRPLVAVRHPLQVLRLEPFACPLCLAKKTEHQCRSFVDYGLLFHQTIRKCTLPFSFLPGRFATTIDMPMVQDFLGTPEMRRRSTAYLPGDVLRPCYVAGGFVGGRTSDFVAMAHFIQDRIDIDDDNDVVAIWHDESHFNKFFADNPNRYIPDSSSCPARRIPDSAHALKNVLVYFWSPS